MVMAADETSVEFDAAPAGLVESSDAVGVESPDDSGAAERVVEFFFAGFVSAESLSAGFVGLAVVPLVADLRDFLFVDFLVVDFLVVEPAGVDEPGSVPEPLDAVPVVDGDPAPAAEGPEADVPPVPEPEPDDVDDGESDPPPVVSVAQTGADATADPTPRAMASAPTRPTNRAYPMKHPPCLCIRCLPQQTVTQRSLIGHCGTHISASRRFDHVDRRLALLRRFCHLYVTVAFAKYE
jgi:hypothetical protein